jgi:hypothetical protein
VSAYEELERQLSQRVATRAWARSGPTASFTRWWRASVGRGGATATLVLMAVLGVMLVAGTDHADRSVSATSSLSTTASKSRCGLCRTFGGQLHGPMASAQASAETRVGGLSTRERRGLSVVAWSRSAAKA